MIATLQSTIMGDLVGKRGNEHSVSTHSLEFKSASSFTFREFDMI